MGGLCTEGNLGFKIDCALLILGRKFAVFLCFTLYLIEGNFQVQPPGEAYIWRSVLTEVFLRYEFGGLIFGGAYTWRGLFLEVYGIVAQKNSRYFSMPPLVSPRKITSKEQAQRFHTYDLPLPSYGIVLLIR